MFFPRGPLFLHTYEPVAEEEILGVRSIQSYRLGSKEESMWILRITWESGKQRTYALDDRLEVAQLIMQHIADNSLVKIKLRWEP